jgi:cell division protein FtsI (penicillin-binding protein 3)
MGFFPAEDPQIAILITLDEPQRDKWGGVAAAPVFKSIGEQILTCFKTNIRDNPQPFIEEEKIVPPMGVRLVSAKSIIPDAEAAAGEASEPVMPDFRGLTIRETLKKSREKGIEIKAIGSGWAVSQYPAPGVYLKDHKTYTVSFKTGY